MILKLKMALPTVIIFSPDLNDFRTVFTLKNKDFSSQRKIKILHHLP